MSIGKTIAQLRAEAGLTQKQLADKVLCDHTLIAKMEIGVREPKAAMIVAMAEALGCTPNDLLGYSEKEVTKLKSESQKRKNGDD